MTAAHRRVVVAFCRSLSPKPIKAVAITHWHNDHPQGISAIRDAYPAVRIIATRATEAGMLGPEAFDVGYAPDTRAEAAAARRFESNKNELRQLLQDPKTDASRRDRIAEAMAQIDDYGHDFTGTYIVPPTEKFEHEMALADRDVPVTLLFLGRANTAGDLVAWLSRQRIIASGDIVVSPVPFGFGSYPTSWLNVLQQLKAMKFNVLIPGHGDPQMDVRYLDQLVAMIKDMQNKVALLSQRGASPQEVREKYDMMAAADLFGATDRYLAFDSLFVEPMLENIYKESHNIPILQGEGLPVPEFSQAPPRHHSRHHRH